MNAKFRQKFKCHCVTGKYWWGVVSGVLLLLLTFNLDFEVEHGLANRKNWWKIDAMGKFWPLATADACDLPLTAVTRAAFQCLKELEKKGRNSSGDDFGMWAPHRSRSAKSESDMAPAADSESRIKLKQMLSARPVGAVALEEVTYFCNCALEGEDPELCAEAASNFSQAVGKASQAALRSSSSASACAMFASLLRHPEDRNPLH
eukprot:s435_g7.t1